MVEYMQSGDQTMASENLAWQAMPHFSEIGFRKLDIGYKLRPKVQFCGSA